MTENALDRRPARATGTIAALVAAAAVAVIGWEMGHGRFTALALLGSGLLAAGAWGLDAPERTRQAGGSVAATAGAAVLFGLFVLAVGGQNGWILFALGVGLTLVAVDAAVGSEWVRIRNVTSVMSENVQVALVGAVVVTVLSLLLAFGVARALLGGALAISTVTPLAGFVTLQLLALSVALAIPRAVSLLSGWTAVDEAGGDRVLDSLGVAGLGLDDVPRVYWVVLAVQAVAALTPQANRLFDLFFGDVLGPVLTSGVLHGLLGVVLLALLAVFAASVIRVWVVGWLGAVPAQTLSVQAGGVTSVLVAVLIGLVLEYLPDSRLVDLIGALATHRYAAVGVPVVALLVLALAIVAVVLLLEVGPAIARLGFVPGRATGFALGSALLFVAALASATAGVPPVAVFVGVAASLLVWDLGSHATTVGRQLGGAAVTRRAEFVRIAGSSLVLAGAVALATLARYVVVPATAPPGTGGGAGLATLSMILVLVALLAFVAAVHVRGREAEA